MKLHVIGLTLSLTACAGAASQTAQQTSPQAAATPPETTSVDRPQYPSTYRRTPYPPVLIGNATILTGTGQEIAGGSILFRDGRIVAVGQTLQAPADAQVVDGTGKFVTPGVIDTHSHIGVYAAPGTFAESDGNELPVSPNTAHVWAEHAIWPQDPQIPLAIAGGVTTMQVLPGSGNLIGGRGVTVKVIPVRTVQEMKFPDAPYGLKMACGENPKRVYGERGGPATRMGNMAGYRSAFIAAENYRHKWDKWLADKKGDQPERNLRDETLMEVLRGHILVQNHCYRADEMVQMLDLAREFGFQIRSFHHGVEAYKIADRLAEAGTAASIWADWWGFKEEAMDGIPENAALMFQAGARPVIHSDSPEGIQRLNQEAAKAMYAGRRAGIDVSRADAVKWFTSNAAWVLGIDSIVGTLEAGKMADLVLWSGDPFSVYSRAMQVYNDGYLIYDRSDPTKQVVTDFGLGQVKR
ncbi:MAG: amidohydrolase family protein [Gemmatimonadetes bacterium]|nr:amidohydrolase family protein [Gemmatimonadota bacterium]MBI2402351.1 amidohydrolase family protein [Gemmatimonadota bacterium]